MRLGLLGPAGGEIGALGRAAEFLLNGARVHRAIYLGNDGALDRAVAAWARKLVGDDPSDDAAWTRAANVALQGTPAQIDRFVATERARLRLKALEALPYSPAKPAEAPRRDGVKAPEPIARTIEMVGDRVAVLIYDKAQLDEEDILAANILVFGKSDVALVDKVGPRWFVTPGAIGRGAGLAVLDDEQEEVLVTVYDASGKPTHREVLSAPRAQPRAHVQGDP